MTSANNSHAVLHRLRALIVEDDPADAELIVAELRRSGFDVLWDRVETEEQYLAYLAGIPCPPKAPSTPCSIAMAW